MTPRATLVLIIGANLPDIDAVAALFGPDSSLLFRRGWTHGVMALAVLPWLLAEAVLWHGRRYPGSAAAGPADRWRLVALAYLAVISHPLLDWLNTYGVRLLMPFDGRWFYGDVLRVVDPWMWLLAGASSVLAHSHSRRSRVGWSTIASLTTALVWLVPGVPLWACGLWTGGVLALALAVSRSRRPQQVAVTVVARAGLTTLVLYLIVMVVASGLAASQAKRWWRSQGTRVERVVANPYAANPFRHRVIGVSDGAYHFVDTEWITGAAPFTTSPPLPHETVSAAIHAARSAQSVKGFVGWTRLPSYEVRATPEGYRVIMRDLRYSGVGDAGFGIASVHLDRQLRVLD